MRTTRLLTRLVFAGALCLALSGCKQWSERGAKGRGLIPPPKPEEVKFSSFQPQNPYLQVVPGLLSRALFAADEADGMRVEVRDLLVGPNQTSASTILPGTATCEVRSGSGVLSLGEKRQQFHIGETFVIPDGQNFTIANESEIPIGIRVHLISAR